MLALLTLVATLLAYRDEIFDRYHYAGVIGFAIALASFFPREREVRLAKATAVWIGALALFSVLGVRDYFRWNDARAALLTEATARGIAIADIDAGFEPNGWNSLENHARSPGCGPATAWLCSDRPFRIGIAGVTTDSVLLSRPSGVWLARFPDLEIIRQR
jgi:hypothetical protein